MTKAPTDRYLADLHELARLVYISVASDSFLERTRVHDELVEQLRHMQDDGFGFPQEYALPSPEPEGE